MNFTIFDKEIKWIETDILYFCEIPRNWLVRIKIKLPNRRPSSARVFLPIGTRPMWIYLYIRFQIGGKQFGILFWLEIMSDTVHQNDGFFVKECRTNTMVTNELTIQPRIPLVHFIFINTKFVVIRVLIMKPYIFW